ncbi:MAG: hypothetical protein HGA35_07210, partial [Erysipelotrichaceae bacterium]|nr:hypothetical protein [Erysipelotrichaceae bacterium]
MFSIQKFKFIWINVLFTLSYLILSIQYIRLDDLALKPILIILFFLNSFILCFPKKTRIGILFILIALASTYFGIQTIFYRSFNQYGMITTALSVQSNMFKFAGSVLEFIRWVDVIYVLTPFVALYLAIKLLKYKQVESNIIRQVLMILLFLSLSYTQYTALHKELEASKSDPVTLVDAIATYSNIPNTNVFVAQFGLNGLLLREFDIRITPIEIQKELTLEEQITQLLNQKNEPTRSDYSGIFEG